MADSDSVATAVRTFLQTKLDQSRKAAGWPLPSLATDVDLEDDAYVAVHTYSDREAARAPFDVGVVERRDLMSEQVPLQRLVHTRDLTNPQLKGFLESPTLSGDAAPDSARGILDALVTSACLTQVWDFRAALHGPLVELAAFAVEAAVQVMAGHGRIVLVTVQPPPKAVADIIKHDDERIVYHPLHVLVPEAQWRVAPIAAFLVAGDPPLSMRYLAHDLRVSVAAKEDDGGVRVELEERRGWWISPSMHSIRFKALRS